MDCTKYELSVISNNIPAFSESFKRSIETINQETMKLQPYRLKVTKTGRNSFETFLNSTTEATFDVMFEHLIREFGTHYMDDVTLGKTVIYKDTLKKIEVNDNNKVSHEKCLKEIRHQRMTKTDLGSDQQDSCKNKDIEEKILQAMENGQANFKSIGGSSGNLHNVHEWTSGEIANPAVIDFKVTPILNLLDPKKMTFDRISDKYGFPIDVRNLLSWIQPRYEILMDKCRILPNHRVSDHGSTCVPCKAGYTATRDGLRCLSKFDIRGNL